MRVLVTGANGFLGSWVTRRLIKEGLDVVILRRESSDISEILDIKAPHVIGDVVNYESLEKHLAGIDTVFHLAGLVAYTQAKRAAMQKVNVHGTRNVVMACLKHKVRRLVHLSSVVAVGASFDGKHPLNETSPYNVANLNLGYFQTKHDGEQLVLEATRTQGLDAVILNPATVYGSGDAKKGSRSTQIRVARGEFPFYTGGGVNVVAVEDVVEGVWQGWQKGRTGERYILANENLTIHELFKMIARQAYVAPPRIYLPRFLVHKLGKVGDMMEARGSKWPINSENAWTSTLYHWFDSSKARRELGLQFRPAEEAVAASVSWMKTQGYLKAIPRK